MTKTKKLFVVLSTVVLLLAIVVINACATSIPELPNVPMFYGQYTTSNGNVNSRNIGGYLPESNYNYLYNNANSIYFWNYYDTYMLNAQNGFGILEGDVRSSSTLPTLYFGATTSHSLFNENNFVYAPFCSVNPFELELVTYVAEENTHRVLSRYHVESDTYSRLLVDIVYIDGEEPDVVKTISNYNDIDSENPYTKVENCGFYGSGDLFTIADVMTYLEPSYKPKTTDKIVYVDIMFDVPRTYVDSPDKVYQPYLYFALPDVNTYVSTASYLLGVRSFGYDIGFRDGSDFHNLGIWSLVENSVSGFLAFDIWSGFTIGELMLVCICVPLFIWILKMFAGG